MARLVRPLLQDEGYFDLVAIDPNRLYSQIRQPQQGRRGRLPAGDRPETGRRWSGDPAQCGCTPTPRPAPPASRALPANNVLDFSLQVEGCWRHLCASAGSDPNTVPRSTGSPPDHQQHQKRRHPIQPRILPSSLPALPPARESTLLISTIRTPAIANFSAPTRRRLLLRGLCQVHVAFAESFVTSPALLALAVLPDLCFGAAGTSCSARRQPVEVFPHTQRVVFYRKPAFYPQMLDWVAGEIAARVDEGTSPSEIVVLAPFLSDSLRFSLMNRLDAWASRPLTPSLARCATSPPPTHS